MAEHSGEKIRPAPTYAESPPLDEAYNALERLSKPSNGAPPEPHTGNFSKISLKSIEEVTPTGNSALLDAIAKIYTVATRQIAYHEREAARLREALKPFATLAPPRQPAAPDSVPLEDGVRQLLAIADRLGIEGEQGK